jgi:lysophospholipase L1-like esterase
MKRILCYGDSNTWGHNPEPAGNNMRYPDEERWTGVLQECLAGKAKIIEEGLCGRTIMYDDPTAPDRNGSRFLNCCLQSHQPLDLVIFMLGTNDIRHIFTPSVKEIAMGMQNLVKTAQNPGAYWVGNVPQILVIVPAPVHDKIADSDFYGMYDEISVEKSKQLAEAYEKIFLDMPGVSVMDAGSIAEVSVKDCIHLSKAGHRDLGKAVAERVRVLLQL